MRWMANPTKQHWYMMCRPASFLSVQPWHAMPQRVYFGIDSDWRVDIYRRCFSDGGCEFFGGAVLDGWCVAYITRWPCRQARRSCARSAVVHPERLRTTATTSMRVACGSRGRIHARDDRSVFSARRRPDLKLSATARASLGAFDAFLCGAASVKRLPPGPQAYGNASGRGRYRSRQLCLSMQGPEVASFGSCECGAAGPRADVHDEVSGP